MPFEPRYHAKHIHFREKDLYFSYHPPVFGKVICADILYVVGESLVQPQVLPPFHGHQISKPLGKSHRLQLSINHKPK